MVETVVEMSPQPKVEQRRALVLIDFDLTLLQSYDFAGELFDYVATAYQVPREALIFTPGEATDTMELIETALGREVDPEILAEDLYQYLLAQGKPPEYFLQPDALDFLQHVEGLPDVFAMIITKGGNKTQRVKLAFMRRVIEHLPVMILPPNIDKKAENVHQEFFHDGYYRVILDGVEYRSDQLVLVEDKISELEGLEPVADGMERTSYALGLWVLRKEMTEAQKAQQLALQAAGQDLIVTQTLKGASNAIDAMLTRRHL